MHVPRTPLLLLTLALAGCGDNERPTGLMPAAPAFLQLATSPVVNTLLDDGTGCTDAKCTLRDAIAFASAGGTVTFAAGVTGTITLDPAKGYLHVNKNLIITGPGAALLTVARSTAQGTPAFPIFDISSTVEISGLTISGGRGVFGGGFFNSGTLTLTNSAVSGNSVTQNGGGIYNSSGTLTLTNTAVSGNSAAIGGGILNNGGSVTLTNSTLSANSASSAGGAMYNVGTVSLTGSSVWGNSASEQGGGIGNYGPGTLTVTNSTVSGNASPLGAGFYNAGTLTLLHSTVVRNGKGAQGGSGVTFGGGIYNYVSGQLSLTSSIVAENQGNPVDIGNSGGIAATYSLLSSSGSSGITSTVQNGNLVSVAPLIGSLADNGGPTLTHALMFGSPAIDHVPSGTNGCGTPDFTDQRGIARPQGSACDIGAFERVPPVTVATGTSLSAAPTSPRPYGTSVTFTATVTLTAGGTAVTSGTVGFYTGGASCADLTGATQVGTNQPLSVSGVTALSTAGLSVGVHTIRACYGGADGLGASGSSVSYTIEAIATTTTLSLTPSTQQYSDKVGLSAAVLPSAATGSVQFQRSTNGGISYADIGSSIAVVSGVAAMTYQVLEAAGADVRFKAVFTGTGNYGGSPSDPRTLIVTKESATIVYDGANPAALQVSTPGGSLAPNALTLALQVRETSPDLAILTAAHGGVVNAGLSVTLAPVGPGSSYILTCTPGAVTGIAYAAARPFTCTNPAAVAVNAYEVQAAVTGSYYTGSYADAFTVFDPSLGFAGGGGSFLLGGEKVNFGFTMKYKKGGTGVQGNMIAVRHHADGTTSRLKSNALGSLALGEDAAVPMGWTTFDGKATYTTWSVGADDYVTVGNQAFTVYAEDRDNPGAGTDRIWLDAPAALDMPGTLATAKVNVAELMGGNIAVPHGGPKGGGGKKN